MAEWPTIPLGEVATFINGDRGKNYPQAEDRVAEGVPFINAGHLAGGRVRKSKMDYITPERYQLLRSGHVKVGDVILCIRGSLGRAALATSDVVPAAIASSLVLIRPRTRILPRFLLAFLEGPIGFQLIAAADNGAAQPNVGAGAVARFGVPLPPIDVQEQICGVLQALDDLIENNRRRIEILEKMARLIYREWFVHFRFPGHEDVELVDSDLGPIPEGWNAVPLSDLVTTQYGYTESAQDDPVGPRYLRGMDMNKTSFIDWSTVPYCPISDSDREKFKVHVGDVFVIRMADPGKIGICEREVDAVFASYLVRLKPIDSRLLPYYLFFTLSDDRYQGWVTGASTGATRKSVSAKVMTEPPVVLAPQHVQAQFVDTIAPIRELLTNLLEQNGVLTEARDLLLPRLISGELDVSGLDLDLEPVA